MGPSEKKRNKFVQEVKMGMKNETREEEDEKNHSLLFAYSVHNTMQQIIKVAKSSDIWMSLKNKKIGYFNRHLT